MVLIWSNDFLNYENGHADKTIFANQVLGASGEAKLVNNSGTFFFLGHMFEEV